jgi:4-amino-4-deoxy-L-arabinose transferase-like glycosyltransferase
MSVVTRERVREADVAEMAGRSPMRVEAASRSQWIQLLPCVAVVAVSLTLNTWSLSMAGYGNTYYAAAVRSMTMSWKNFFFGAFDPGGFITVDKPPVFLWVGALSARTFGYSTWSLILPSSIAGAASVGLLWLIVRRHFGVTAATIAGSVLALSPISVAVDRLNLPEPFLVLALIAAAGAVLQSLESPNWRAWIVVAGVLVGVAFNVKMLAAWIPGPAFAAAIVVASPRASWDTARELLPRLALLGAVTLVVSASWLLVVDAWPRSDRPYIGSSTNNSAVDLALGYNGFARLAGDGGGAVPVVPGGEDPGGVAGPGGIFGGYVGPLRLFDNANGGQIGWLLPFAIGGGLAALWSWRFDPRRRAAVLLFLGWIALYGEVFSFAHGTFHAFYTSAMVPGVAALVGIGAAALAKEARSDGRWLIALVGLVALTLWTQIQIAGRTPDFYAWVQPLTVTVTFAGGASVIALALQRSRLSGGIALGVAGLLLLPAAWSVSAAANPSLNATLPQAGPQRGAAGSSFGSLAFDDGTAGLAAWLKSHDDPGATWQLVVPNSQDGSRLIAQYGLSVMALGGFLGWDNTISVSRFADLAASGSVRYVLLTGGFDAIEENPVLWAVGAACRPVEAASLPAKYRDSLYDCSGRAARIRQHTTESATGPAE